MAASGNTKLSRVYQQRRRRGKGPGHSNEISEDERNTEILARIKVSIDGLFAQRDGEGGWKNGVTDREVQDLVALGASFPDPFACFERDPIREMSSIRSRGTVWTKSEGE